VQEYEKHRLVREKDAKVCSLASTRKQRIENDKFSKNIF